MSYSILSSQFHAMSPLQFSLQPAQRQGVFASVDEWEKCLTSFEQAIDRVKGSKSASQLVREIEEVTHTLMGGAEDLTSNDTRGRIEKKIEELRGKIKEVNNSILKNGSFLMKLSYYLDWDWLKRKSGAPQINTTRLVENVRLDLNKRKVERAMQQLLFPLFPADMWSTSREQAEAALEQQTKAFPVAAKFPRFQLYQEPNGVRHILSTHHNVKIDWQIGPSSKPGLLSLYEPKSGQRMECDPYLYDPVTKERAVVDLQQLKKAFEIVCGEHTLDAQKKLPAAQARQDFADVRRDAGLYSLREMGLQDKGSLAALLPAITDWAKGFCKGHTKSHFIVTNSDNPADPKSAFLLVSYDPGILKSSFTFQEVYFDDQGREIVSTLTQEKGGAVITEISEASFEEVLQTKGKPLKSHIDATLLPLQKEVKEVAEILEDEKAKIRQLARAWKTSSLDAQRAAFSSAKRRLDEARKRAESAFKKAGLSGDKQAILSDIQRDLRAVDMRLMIIGQSEHFFVKAPEQKTVAEMEQLYTPLTQSIGRLATEVGGEEAGALHALIQPTLIRDMIPLWMDEVETKMLPALKVQMDGLERGNRAKAERQRMMLSMQYDLALSWEKLTADSPEKERLGKIIKELEQIKRILEKTSGFQAGRDLYYQCTFHSGALTRDGQSQGGSLQKVSLTAAAIGLGFMITSGAYYYGASSSLSTSAALSLFGVGAVVAAQPYLPDSGEWQMITQAGIHIAVGLAVMAGYRAYHPIPWHSPASIVGYAGQAGAAASAVVQSAQATASRVSDFAWSFFANSAAPALDSKPGFVKPEALPVSRWVRPSAIVRPQPLPNVPVSGVAARGHYWSVLDKALMVAQAVSMVAAWTPAAVAIHKGA